MNEEKERQRIEKIENDMATLSLTKSGRWFLRYQKANVEANQLAEMLAIRAGCPDTGKVCPHPNKANIEFCTKCWRMAARKVLDEE